jgi:hypothetical protein
MAQNSSAQPPMARAQRTGNKSALHCAGPAGHRSWQASLRREAKTEQHKRPPGDFCSRPSSASKKQRIPRSIGRAVRGMDPKPAPLTVTRSNRDGRHGIQGRTERRVRRTCVNGFWRNVHDDPQRNPNARSRESSRGNRRHSPTCRCLGKFAGAEPTAEYEGTNNRNLVRYELAAMPRDLAALTFAADKKSPGSSTGSPTHWVART